MFAVSIIFQSQCLKISLAGCVSVYLAYEESFKEMALNSDFVEPALCPGDRWIASFLLPSGSVRSAA